MAVRLVQWSFFFFFYPPPFKRDREALMICPNRAEDIYMHRAEENSTHDVTGSGTDSKQTEQGLRGPVDLFGLILTAWVHSPLLLAVNAEW